MNSFKLKVIGLLCMVLDHLYQFYPLLFPVYFKWAGRLAAPIFTFCIVQGMYYTRDAKKYVTRLYMGSVIMMIGNFILLYYFPLEDVTIRNNIFTTFAILGMILYVLQKKISTRKKVGFLLTFLVIQIISTVLMVSITNKLVYLRLMSGALPNLFFCEGGWTWILFGILMYKVRSSKKKICLVIGGYSLFLFMITVLVDGIGGIGSSVNCEWMLGMSILPISFWNEARGKSIKYFFYLFYPIHIWSFYLLAYFWK